MNSTSARQTLARRATAAVIAAGVTTMTVAVGPAMAETTDTQTATFDLGDLDRTGTATFQQFDAAVGTLTAVDITAEVVMDFSVCITNLGQASTSLPAGLVDGVATVTFAGDVVAEATGAMDVPAVELDANAGGDPCQTWLDTGVEPTTGDSVLFTGSDTSEFAETIADPALAEYVGTGTVDFGFTASSDSSIAQPSAWTIIFLASGQGESSAVYRYEPGRVEPSPTPPAPENSEPLEPEEFGTAEAGGLGAAEAGGLGAAEAGGTGDGRSHAAGADADQRRHDR